MKKSYWVAGIARFRIGADPELVRRHSGMKLKEFGTRVGGLDYGAVSEAIRRLQRQIKVDRKLNALYARLRDDLLEN